MRKEGSWKERCKKPKKNEVVMKKLKEDIKEAEKAYEENKKTPRERPKEHRRTLGRADKRSTREAGESR